MSGEKNTAKHLEIFHILSRWNCKRQCNLSRVGKLLPLHFHGKFKNFPAPHYGDKNNTKELKICRFNSLLQWLTKVFIPPERLYI